MKRNIITINQEKCTGCGMCIPNCPEGAIQIIDGKARLISDLFCDGLGACLGHCPEGAIAIEQREAESYDETKVMENIIKQGTATIIAHLKHLKEHNQMEYFKQAMQVLDIKGIENPFKQENEMNHNHNTSSYLSHWPVQLHLISPTAPHYQGSDIVLSADCVAYAVGDFHRKYLKGKTLAIACPKLDEGKEVYVEKITALIDEAKINTLTVITMQVPCCGGLLHIAQEGVAKATRKIPLKYIVVSLQGDVLKEEWV